MAMGNNHIDDMPVIRDLRQFDPHSGNRFERLIFNHRFWVVLLCAVVTGLLLAQGTRVVINASFEKMLPQNHPYIQNYLEHEKELRGLGNTLRVVVENPHGDIFDPGYLQALAEINDALFLMPGVDRSWMKSLWTPVVRWTEVTEEGFEGGPVIPDTYDGSPESMAQVRLNIARAGIVGSLVGNDYRSSMIVVPLLSRIEETNQPLDYGALSRMLEDKVRLQYEVAQHVEEQVRPLQSGTVKIHIIGFAKLVGDLIDGLVKVMMFFAVAAVVAALIIYLYTRCVRSTVLVVLCSLIAVVWEVGLVNMLGFALDPFSILVPFLVFAIGVSHGAQKMNGIMQDIARGTHKLVAARYTFRRLFVAGLTALLADAVGFAVLMLIDIPVIQDLAVTASIGVGVLIFTNLILLPVLLSYTGVSQPAAQRALADEAAERRGRGLGAVWQWLDRFTERRWAVSALLGAAVLAAGGFMVALELQIGDLDAGAPELRPDSRYNLDNAYVTAKYGLSSDVFAVMVKTPKDGCERFATQVEADRLAWTLRQVPGVQTTVSLVDSLRHHVAGTFEGSPKWNALVRNEKITNVSIHSILGSGTDLVNSECSIMPVIAYLSDHKADTLTRVVAAAEAFAAEHGTPERQFLLAAGSAGIEAATNIVVREANREMLVYVYCAVTLLCLVAFRSWRATVVAVVPLVLTSILAEALMVVLGIGVKVATLPVIALGVGIGVDYALYLLSVQLANQRAGQSLTQAYRGAVAFTGKVVALVGITLAAGVVTWAWSPIKFQADMGILLTFMFLWNMLGALILIPALSHFLLGRPALAGAPAAPTAPPPAAGGSPARGTTLQRGACPPAVAMK
ncbi:efflux RND transporter permease subunit [Thauera linaloolentis]|nr:MMPL family transporter [Thauera linaloolentis]MCM8565482.1 MMPL family transporter [Thauera linaloolentis]